MLIFCKETAGSFSCFFSKWLWNCAPSHCPDTAPSACMFTMPGNRNWVAKVVHHQNSTLFQKLTARLLKIKWCFSSLFHLFVWSQLGNKNRFLIFGRCLFYSKRDKDSWSPKMRILPNPNFPPPRNGELPKKLKLWNVPRWSGGGFLFAGGLLWDTCFF